MGEVVRLKADIKKESKRFFEVIEVFPDGSVELKDSESGKVKVVSEVTLRKSYKFDDDVPHETEDKQQEAKKDIIDIDELKRLFPSQNLAKKNDTEDIYVAIPAIIDGVVYYNMQNCYSEEVLFVSAEDMYSGYEIVVETYPFEEVTPTNSKNDVGYEEDPLPDSFGFNEVARGNEKDNEAIDRAINGQDGNDNKGKGKEEIAVSKEDAAVHQVSSSWSLVPSYPNPEGIQKPKLQQQEEVLSDSMRAKRDKEEGQPFKPKHGSKLRQSMLSQYLQCPDKFYEINEGDYTESSIFTRVGTAVHGVMEDFYSDPQNADIESLFEQWWVKHGDADPKWYEEWRCLVLGYFERNKTQRPNIVALEYNWEATIEGIECSGTIDRIDRIDERTLKIVDYKTNFKEFTTDELEQSIQFKFYTLALEQLKHIVGDFDEVICEYEMLRLGISQQVIFTREELDEFGRWLRMVNTKIHEGRDREPRLNKYCGYCEKRHKCGMYQELVTSKTPSILTETINMGSITEQREQLKAIEKVINGRVKEIDEMIKLKIAENGGEFIVDGYKWNTKAGTRQSYDTQKVIQTLALLGKAHLIPNVVNISSTALKNALKGEKEILQALDSAKNISYISPTLNRSKVK